MLLLPQLGDNPEANTLPVSSEFTMRGVLFVGCIALACAHTTPTASPPPLTDWREVGSAHFRLRTDLPEGAARETLGKLDDLRTWLQAAWSTGGDSPGTTNVIVLSNANELWTFTHLSGIATTSRQGPVIVVAGTGSEFLFGDRSPQQQVLAHEVAHDLIRRRMPGAPRWFHEGLATYLQTVFQRDDRHIRFGLSSVWNAPHRKWVTDPEVAIYGPDPPATHILPLDTLGTVRWEDATPSEIVQLYWSACIWIYLLRTGEPERMSALEAALASGTPWRVAWARLRNGLDPDRLREKLFGIGWKTEVREIPSGSPRAPPVSERALAPWEVHLCLAELWSLAARMPGGSGLAPRVRSEVEAAAAAAPDRPAPEVWLADLETDRDVRRERAEALVHRFPGNADALVFRARVLRDDGGSVEGRRDAALEAVTAAPDNVDALTAHAIEEIRTGDADGALRTVRRAEELEPWNPTVFVAQALVLGSIGRCDDAVEAIQRALDVLPDNPPLADLRALVRERERIRGACHPTAAR
jgi:hypothetical protein